MKLQSGNLRSYSYFRAAFTLIEMVVSVSLLVVIILAVGLIFQSATTTVGVSEKTLEVLSNVRSIQAQMDRDVSGVDKNCFLAIRGATFTDSQGTVRRCDLVSFISYGSFTHRTGASSAASPFTDDHPTTPSASVTWGQLALAKTGGSNSSPTDPSVYLDASNQTYQVPQNQVPTGIVTTLNGLNEGDLTLGRNAILLFPQNVLSSTNIAVNTNSLVIGGFQNNTSSSPPVAAIDFNTGLADAISPDSLQSSITQSRVDAASTTPLQIMNYINQAITSLGGRSGALRYEAEHFCFRHAAVRSPYDGIGGNVVNGYFRMHPIALQGVSSFIVEWSDGVTLYPLGTTDPVTGADIGGSTKWFGLGNPDPNYTSWSTGNPTQTTGNVNDGYSIVFSYDTARAKWPVALRFRFHVADPTGRLQGGRDFTQIVRLPY